MKYGIICALDEEISLFTKTLTNISYKQIGILNYIIGKINENDVVICKCSVGKVNAAICTTLLIQNFNPDYVINAGIAGCTDKTIGVLGVVLSSSCSFHDIDNVMLNYSPKTNEFLADTYLIDVCEKAIKEIGNIEYVVGKIATGDQFICDKSIKNSIVERFSPSCVEMEGAAVAQTCHLLNVPFLVLRTMSDNADDNAENSYDNFIERSANISSGIIIKALSL